MSIVVAQSISSLLLRIIRTDSRVANSSRVQLGTDLVVFNPLAIHRRANVVILAEVWCNESWSIQAGHDFRASQLVPILTRDVIRGSRRGKCQLVANLNIRPLEALGMTAIHPSASTAQLAQESHVSVHRLTKDKKEVAFSWQLRDRNSLKVTVEATALGSDQSLSISICRKNIGGLNNCVEINVLEYYSSNGFGVGQGWGSSSGAYIFRTTVSALFGVGASSAAVSKL